MEENEKIEEKVQLKYKKADVEGGYITDPDQIEYVAATQKFEVINNLMLGDFNATGDYVISEDILRELVALNKVEMERYADTVFATSPYDFGANGKLEFALVFSNLEREICSATLKLLEKVENVAGYYVNTNSFVVATFSDTNSDHFEEDAKKVFRISPVTKEIKEDEKTYKAISARIEKMKLLKQVVLPKIEEAEKENYIKRMELLVSDPKYAEVITKFDAERKRIAKALAQRFGDKRQAFDENHPLYYTYLNQILNNMIDLEMARSKGNGIYHEVKKAFVLIDKERNKVIGVIIAKGKESIDELSAGRLVKEQKTPTKAPVKQKTDSNKKKGSERTNSGKGTGKPGGKTVKDKSTSTTQKSTSQNVTSNFTQPVENTTPTPKKYVQETKTTDNSKNDLDDMYGLNIGDFSKEVLPGNSERTK